MYDTIDGKKSWESLKWNGIGWDYVPSTTCGSEWQKVEIIRTNGKIDVYVNGVKQE